MFKTNVAVDFRVRGLGLQELMFFDKDGDGDGLKTVVQLLFRPFRPLDFDLFGLLAFDLFNLRRVSGSDGPEGMVTV